MTGYCIYFLFVDTEIVYICQTKNIKQRAMEQIILHAIGDYLIQNDWMAQNKKKLTLTGELACQIHCITYSLPFFLIGGWLSVLIIYLTHYAIDRSQFVNWFMCVTGKSDFAKPPLAPWGIFAVDNTFHLICNYCALAFCF